MPDLGAAVRRIEAYLDRHLERLDTPGLSLALTDRTSTLAVLHRGFANLDARETVSDRHRFQIGSISKGFTAMALLQEREAGRLDLDAPVTTYLPWFSVRSTFGPIAVHHLLSHTAGIVCGMDATGEAMAEVWSLRETPAAWPPGERFLYSNLGYKALGLVLEAVTGRPWWEVVRERVMAPIGMGDADVIITDAVRGRLAVGYTSPYGDRPWLPRHGFAPSPWFESATADGTICATADELARYARLLLNRGAGVLRPESFELMTRPVAEDPSSPGHVYGYGLKWIDGRLLGHSGGMIGFTAYLLVDPRAGVGAALLMNSAFGRRLEAIRFALDCLAAAVEGAALPEVPEPAPRERVPDAASLAGTFTDELGAVELAAEGERLFLAEGGDRAPLVPLEGGRFVVDDPARERYPIGVVREDGRAVELRWGPRWLRAPGRPDRAEPSPEHRAFAGRYRSWNPWAPGFEVFARRDGLWLEMLGSTADVEDSQPLTPLPDGSFAVGEPPTPSRIRFDLEIGGLPRRAWLDAAPFYRSDVP